MDRVMVSPVERLAELGGIATRGTLLRTCDRRDLDRAVRSRRHRPRRAWAICTRRRRRRAPGGGSSRRRSCHDQRGSAPRVGGEDSPCPSAGDGDQGPPHRRTRGRRPSRRARSGGRRGLGHHPGGHTRALHETAPFRRGPRNRRLSAACRRTALGAGPDRRRGEGAGVSADAPGRRVRHIGGSQPVRVGPARDRPRRARTVGRAASHRSGSRTSSRGPTWSTDRHGS